MGGIAVRSQESPVHTGLWNALGAKPIVMEISEVQGKLEKGEITVAAQTPLYTFAAGWQGFLKHYSLTRHVYQTALIMYSKEFFDAQDADIKAALMTDRQEGADLGRKLVRQLAPQLIGNFTSYGINVIKLSDAERSAFQEGDRGCSCRIRKTSNCKKHESFEARRQGQSRVQIGGFVITKYLSGERESYVHKISLYHPIVCLTFCLWCYAYRCVGRGSFRS